MNKLAGWIGLFLLATSTQSCLSSGIGEWAAEKAPRSEVLGFIDGNGSGDALIVNVSGETELRDGIYLMAVSDDNSSSTPSTVPAPVRLSASEAALLQSGELESMQTARLDGSLARSWAERAAVDRYTREGVLLRRVENSGQLYFVGVANEVESDRGPSFTRVVVFRQGSSNGTIEDRGSALLPPPRRKLGRIILAVIVAPVAVAIDVVTLPVQVAGFVLLIPFMFRGIRFLPEQPIAAATATFHQPLWVIGGGLACVSSLWLAMSGNGMHAEVPGQALQRMVVESLRITAVETTSSP